MAPQLQRLVIGRDLTLPDATPLTQDSTANAANVITVPAISKVAHHVTGYEVTIGGAATGNIVNITIKDGATIIWKDVIASGAPIGTRTYQSFSFPMLITPGNALSLNVDAAGASCITTASLAYFDL